MALVKDSWGMLIGKLIWIQFMQYLVCLEHKIVNMAAS